MGNQCCCCCNYNHRNINSNHHRCSNNEIITDNNNNNNNNNCFINLLNYYPQLLFTNCFRINCNSSFRRNKSTNNTDNKTFDSIENIDELNQNSRNQEQFELQPNQTIDSINNNVIIFSDDDNNDNNNNNNNNNNFKRNNQQSCSFNSSVPSSSSYSLSLSSEQIHNNKGNECKNRSIEQLPGQQQQQQQMPNDRYCHYQQQQQQQLKQQLKQRQQSISDHNTKNVKHLQKLNFNNTVIDSNAIDDTKSSSSSSLLLLSKTDNKTKNQHNRQHYRLFEHQASIQSTPPTIIHSSHHHSNSHCFDCPYNFNPLLLSPTSASNVVRSKLKFDLQRQLNEMIQRQRSASHCPHAVNIDRNTKSGTSSSSKNKCCCCQKARNISINSSQSSKNSGNIVVDPFMQKMVQQHGLSPSSSSSNFHGRQKRASSLRALNKRLNFFDTTNTNFKFDGSSSRNGSRQGSRKQKRQPIKLMDLGDDCLLAIFEYLTLQEKIYYERVCQRWQRLIRLSLQASVSLKIGEHSVKCNCQCAHYPSWDFPPSKRFPRDNVGFIIYPKSTIQYLLTLCNQLKCINFSHCYLDDETLQIIMNHSDKVECLHLNDIRLEEDSDELPNGLLEKSNKQQINEAINNGQQQGDQDSTISSAVGAFASEQLAVFGGLMRKLSTRRSLKKKGNQNQETCSDTAGKRNSNISILSKKSITSSVLNLVNHTGASSPESVNHSSNHVISKCIKNPVNNTRSSPISSSNNTINSGRQINVSKQQQRTNEMSPLIQQSTTTTTTTRMTPNLNLSTTTNATTATLQMDPFEAAIHEKTTAVYFPHDDMRASLENIIRKTQLNNQKQQQQPPKTPSPHNGPQSPTIIFHLAQQQSSSSLSSQPQQQQQHQQQHNSMQKFPPKPSITPSATQRRREWSKHRLTQQTDSNRINNVMMKQLDDQLMMPINVINDTINSNDSFLTLNDESTSVTTTNGCTKSSGNVNRLQNHLSPNLAPNIASIQCDSNNGHRGFNPTITTTATTITSQSGASSSGGSGASIMTGNQLADLNSSEINSNSLTTTQCQSSSLINTNRKTIIDSMIKQMDNNKMDHVQAYVEQEQIRHEIRQSHLSQWKAFAKKLGSQIRSLSLGNLSSVDSIVIDILLKYSTILEELRINNEIDILSYLSVIKHSIKRIYINCEHGIGLECVSLLAYRNYAEKVISLGRVDVPPDLIDSVISTIGSNFCNLQSLYLRIHNFDIDVATPANLLFDNLRELNLQFVSGNVDQPFRQFIQLGWSSVRILTIQYASITEESVRAIHEHMPQLRKLVLYAIEFRCDHLSKRYGHRICMNCSHAVWKSIAALPHLQHLKLYRVIIDDEICKALSRMYRLHHLELQYCSNVNDNVVNVCSELARRCQRRRFTLAIISRGFLTLKPPADCNNLFIDIKVACN